MFSPHNWAQLTFIKKFICWQFVARSSSRWETDSPKVFWMLVSASVNEPDSAGLSSASGQLDSLSSVPLIELNMTDSHVGRVLLFQQLLQVRTWEAAVCLWDRSRRMKINVTSWAALSVWRSAAAPCRTDSCTTAGCTQTSDQIRSHYYRLLQIIEVKRLNTHQIFVLL